MIDVLQHDLITQLARDQEIEALLEENRQLSSRLNEANIALRRERAESERDILFLRRQVYSGNAPVRWDRCGANVDIDREIREGRANQYTVAYRTLEDPHHSLPEAWIKQELVQKIAKKVLEDVEVVVVKDNARREETHIIDFCLLFAEPNRLRRRQP